MRGGGASPTTAATSDAARAAFVQNLQDARSARSAATQVALERSGVRVLPVLAPVPRRAWLPAASPAAASAELVRMDWAARDVLAQRARSRGAVRRVGRGSSADSRAEDMDDSASSRFRGSQYARVKPLLARAPTPGTGMAAVQMLAESARLERSASPPAPPPSVADIAAVLCGARVGGGARMLSVVQPGAGSRALQQAEASRAGGRAPAVDARVYELHGTARSAHLPPLPKSKGGGGSSYSTAAAAGGTAGRTADGAAAPDSDSDDENGEPSSPPPPPQPVTAPKPLPPPPPPPPAASRRNTRPSAASSSSSPAASSSSFNFNNDTTLEDTRGEGERGGNPPPPMSPPTYAAPFSPPDAPNSDEAQRTWQRRFGDGVTPHSSPGVPPSVHSPADSAPSPAPIPDAGMAAIFSPPPAPPAPRFVFVRPPPQVGITPGAIFAHPMSSPGEPAFAKSALTPPPYPPPSASSPGDAVFTSLPGPVFKPRSPLVLMPDGRVGVVEGGGSGVPLVGDGEAEEDAASDEAWSRGLLASLAAARAAAADAAAVFGGSDEVARGAGGRGGADSLQSPLPPPPPHSPIEPPMPPVADRVMTGNADVEYPWAATSAARGSPRTATLPLPTVGELLAAVRAGGSLDMLPASMVTDLKRAMERSASFGRR